MQSNAFQNSLSVLAQIATRETGAEGFGFFRKDLKTGRWCLEIGWGAAIPETALDGQTVPFLVTFVVSSEVVTTGRFLNDAIQNASAESEAAEEGVLAFVFSDRIRAGNATTKLVRIAHAIGSVWKAAQHRGSETKLIHRAVTLEAQLLDSKITDRARGILGNRESRDSVEAIARHVEGVLQSASLQAVLSQTVFELEEELHVRQVAAQAKDILRKSSGMSEEQAHAHLRRVSRTSRKQLKDVALSVIEANGG